MFYVSIPSHILTNNRVSVPQMLVSEAMVPEKIPGGDARNTIAVEVP